MTDSFEDEDNDGSAPEDFGVDPLLQELDAERRQAVRYMRQTESNAAADLEEQAKAAGLARHNEGVWPKGIRVLGRPSGKRDQSIFGLIEVIGTALCCLFRLRFLKEEREVRLAKPPQLIFGSIARLVLKPAAYRRYIEPTIADIHEEYFACLARGDERGARWAVIRGNLYAIPGWCWAVIAQVLLKLIQLIRA